MLTSLAASRKSNGDKAPKVFRAQLEGDSVLARPPSCVETDKHTLLSTTYVRKHTFGNIREEHNICMQTYIRETACTRPRTHADTPWRYGTCAETQATACTDDTWQSLASLRAQSKLSRRAWSAGAIYHHIQCTRIYHYIQCTRKLSIYHHVQCTHNAHMSFSCEALMLQVNNMSARNMDSRAPTHVAVLSETLLAISNNDSTA